MKNNLDLNEAFVEAGSDLKSLNSVLERVENATSDHSDLIKKITLNISDAIARKNELMAEKDAASLRADLLSDRKDSVENRLNSLSKIIEQSTDSMSVRFESTKQRLAELNKEQSDALLGGDSDSAGILQERIDDLQAREMNWISKDNTKVERLESIKNSIETRAVELTTEITAAEDTVDNLDVLIQKQVVQIRGFQENYDAQDETLFTLNRLEASVKETVIAVEDPVIVEGGFSALFYHLSGPVSNLSQIDFDREPDHSEVVSAVNYQNGRDTLFHDGAPLDNIAAKFEGSLKITQAGIYSFRLGSDDGSLLFINGEAVTDRGGLQAFRQETISIDLDAGNHTIELLYFERGGHQGVVLEYQGPDTNDNMVLVDDAVMISDVGSEEPVVDVEDPVIVEGGFSASFYHLSGPVSNLSQIDFDREPDHSEVVSAVNYQNGRDTLFHDGAPLDNIAAKFEGSLKITQAGIYSFRLGSDDGSLLFINGEAVTDRGGLQAFRQETISIDLDAGNHTIELLYFERGGHQGVVLEYQGPDTNDNMVLVDDAVMISDVGSEEPVVDVNEGPVTIDDVASLDEDGSVVINLLVNDSDPDGDSLTIASLGGAVNGIVVNNGDGTITYTPNANFKGSETISYSVSDGNGASATASVAITVASVNDAPVITATALSVSELATNNTVVGRVEGSDIDGDSLSYEITGGNADGIFDVRLNGDIVITNNTNLDYERDTSYALQVQVSDGNGGTDTVNVPVNVRDVFEDEPATEIVANNDSFDVIGGRVTTLDVLGNDTFNPDTDTIRVKDLPVQGNVTVNPDGTLALVLTDPSFSGPLSLTYEIENQAGEISEGTVDLNVSLSPQEAGWGYGDHYMLQTDAEGKTIVESGENHRKVFVTAGDHGLTAADIAGMEGISANQVNQWWLRDNPQYGSSEETALSTELGMDLWAEETGSQISSNWLLFERGYEYNDIGRVIERGSSGESELNPLLVSSYGEGDIPHLNTEILMFQEYIENIVIMDVQFEGVLLLDMEYRQENPSRDNSTNILFDGITSTEESSMQGVDNITIRNSSIIDVYREEPRTQESLSSGIWEGHRERISGIYIDGNEGILIENTLFDYNGWREGYAQDASIDSAQPLSMYSHNLYLQHSTRDVTYRDNINARGASFGAQFRGGAYIEDNVFLDNNIGFNTLGGNYRDFGFSGNYSLVTDNLVTSAGHKTVDVFQGALTWGAVDRALLTTHHDNIIAHLSDPNNAAEMLEKDTGSSNDALRLTSGVDNQEDAPYYDDTIIYNWYTATRSPGEDTNADGLNAADLDQITIQNYAAELTGNPNATISDLMEYIRAGSGSALDGFTDAELIIRYFQTGFGVTLDGSSLGGETLRFVPNDLGEGVRWDNRLNWDQGYTPEDGDNVELAGNWVNYGGTTTLNNLDFGNNGELNVGNGYLKIDNDIIVGEDGARLVVRDSGQFWTNGYDATNLLGITATGGRFANTGDFDGTYNLSISGNAQIIFAVGDGAVFTINSGDTVEIEGSEAKVGFDGSDGDATLKIEEGGVLAFDINNGSTATIREFTSGHFGDASNVNSVVDLGQGDTTLDLDVSDINLANGLYSYDLVDDVDQVIGDFGTINVDGLGSAVSGARVIIDRENDNVSLELSVNDTSLNGLEIDIYASNEADIFYVNDDNSVIETIHNFDASGGDQIDISHLLTGYDPISDAITDFVQMTDDGTDSYLAIDINGNGDNFVSVIKFEGTVGLNDVIGLENNGNLDTII